MEPHEYGNYMSPKEYPFETLIKLEGNSNYVGRIIVEQLGNHFSAEVAIVHFESRKIFQHIKSLHNVAESDEALDLAVQHLSDFLQGKDREH